MMVPIPFNCGIVRCVVTKIKSESSGVLKMFDSPYFKMEIEFDTNLKIPVLFGKKRAFNKRANYIICTDMKFNNRSADTCVGKLRALEEEY